MYLQCSCISAHTCVSTQTHTRRRKSLNVITRKKSHLIPDSVSKLKNEFCSGKGQGSHELFPGNVADVMLLILHLLISGLSSVVCLFCLFVLPVLLSTWHAKEYISPPYDQSVSPFPKKMRKVDKLLHTVSQPSYPLKLRNWRQHWSLPCLSARKVTDILQPVRQACFSQGSELGEHYRCSGGRVRQIYEIASYTTDPITLLLLSDFERTVTFQES